MEAPLTLERYDLVGQDPFANLAAEEALARTCPEGTVRLVFYQNAPAIIVGRNQNPWVEADLREAWQRGVVVARRASGGGTVYHDAGNLNYGFVMPRAHYSPARYLEIVVKALGDLGITATACNRSSVWVGERKVSGTAFLLTGRTALLHGCILVETDLGALRRILAAPALGLRSRAVPSIRSPVVRLCDLRPGLTPGAVRDAIAARAAAAFGTGTAPAAPRPSPELQRPVLERLSSWEWIYGRTADFEHVLMVAAVAITLAVREARVAAVPTADGMPAAQALAQALIGCPYEGGALALAVADAAGLPQAFRQALAEAFRLAIPPLRPTVPCPTGAAPATPPG